MMETITQLSLIDARAMADAAAVRAQEEGCAVVVAVVDAGGHLLLLERGAGAPLASIDVAQEKARCAALYGVPTAMMEKAARASPAMTSLPNMMPIGGGMPLLSGSRVAGAIGVSGGTTEQDIACVDAALAVLITD